MSAPQATYSGRLLAFPHLDRSARQASGFSPDAARLTLALIAGLLLSATFGVQVGRRIEQGTQLGAVLALAEEQRELVATVARQDSALARLGALWGDKRISDGPRHLRRPQRPAATPAGGPDQRSDSAPRAAAAGRP